VNKVNHCSVSCLLEMYPGLQIRGFTTRSSPNFGMYLFFQILCVTNSLVWPITVNGGASDHNAIEDSGSVDSEVVIVVTMKWSNGHSVDRGGRHWTSLRLWPQFRTIDTQTHKHTRSRRLETVEQW
jgi:hypothetical protein